jgi:hypothetical protein
VNVVICVACAVALISVGFLPSLNPIKDPHFAEVKNFHDQRTYTSVYTARVYKAGTAEMPTFDEFQRKRAEYEQRHNVSTLPKPTDRAAYDAAMKEMGYERALTPTWAVWTFRIFWINLLLFLFNMIPAYPLDGGQLLQSLVWARTDHRRGVVVAGYTGFAFAIIFLIVSIVWNEALFLGLSLFMLYSASMRLVQLESEEGPFGYDFSAGYTSLEKDEEPVEKPRRPGFITRWRQARKARKLAREAEARQKEEERMDEILEKIARSGKGSLTDEERRFLERVSARKRNTS